MKVNEILSGIENDIKGSSIEDAASIILDLCSIENDIDLKASLFKRHNLNELLSLYSGEDAEFNKNMSTFVSGLIRVIKGKSSIALFVCRVYLDIRNDFGDAMNLLPDSLTEHFVEGLEAFGRASYDIKHADEFFKESARHLYEIYHSTEFIPKAAMAAVDRCIDRLEGLIDLCVPPLDECGHQTKFSRDKIDGYIDIFSACAKKKAETE